MAGTLMIRQGPAGLPGDVMATPLYHLPIRLADAIARFGLRVNLGDLSEYGLPVPARACLRGARASASRQPLSTGK
jgi:hypothetical protein